MPVVEGFWRRLPLGNYLYQKQMTHHLLPEIDQKPGLTRSQIASLIRDPAE
jgi:hypothetical protein